MYFHLAEEFKNSLRIILKDSFNIVNFLNQTQQFDKQSNKIPRNQIENKVIDTKKILLGISDEILHVTKVLIYRMSLTKTQKQP